jgi:cobalt/nickel transport protein
MSHSTATGPHRTTSPRGRVSTRALVVVGLVVSLLVAAVVSFYASAQPDGLEYVAEQVGFIDRAEDSAVAGSPLADYGTAGVEDERLSVGLAGLVGVAVTGAVAFALMWLLRRRGADRD